MPRDEQYRGVADVPEHQKTDARVHTNDQWTGPLPPEKAAALIARLKAAREAAAEKNVQIRADEETKLLTDPLSHLHKIPRKDWEVVARFLADPSVTLRQLGGMLGYKDWRAIQKVLAKPHIKAFIAQVRAKQVEAIIKGDFGAQALLKQSQVKAASKIVETIDSPTAGAKTNLAAAESVLDRTGLGKSSAVQHHHVHEILRHFTPEEMDAYGNRGIVPERFKTVFAQLEGPATEPDE